MKATFTIKSQSPTAVKMVLIDTDDFVNCCVGEISKDSGKWQFHYRAAAVSLKEATEKEMLTFVRDQIALISIKERLLA